MGYVLEKKEITKEDCIPQPFYATAKGFPAKKGDDGAIKIVFYHKVSVGKDTRALYRTVSVGKDGNPTEENSDLGIRKMLIGIFCVDGLENPDGTDATEMTLDVYDILPDWMTEKVLVFHANLEEVKKEEEGK